MTPEEQKLYDALVKKGFEVYHKGWPDFLVATKYRDRILAIELKAKGDRLTDEQKAVHHLLRLAGLPVVVARDDWPEVIRRAKWHITNPRRIKELGEVIRDFKKQFKSLLHQMVAVNIELKATQALMDTEGRYSVLMTQAELEEAIKTALKELLSDDLSIERSVDGAFR